MSKKTEIEYLYKRGAVYHFYRRVPEPLMSHYGGKPHIRFSLHTKDLHQAKRKRDLILLKQKKEFSALLTEDSPRPNGARALEAAEVEEILTALLDAHRSGPKVLDDTFTYYSELLEYRLLNGKQVCINGDALAEAERIFWKIQKSAGKTTILSHLIADHRREHTSKLTKSTTVREYESVYTLLLSTLPPYTVLTEIHREQAKNIRDILEYLTPNHSVRKETRGHPPTEVANIVKACGLPLPKPATVNKKLTFINALFNYALDEGLIRTNPFRRLRLRESERAKDKRQPFTEGELKLLMESLEVYSQSKQLCALNYWSTLIALHQGMRMGEILQLKRRDISKVKGIWTIRIHADDDDNTLKTRESCRTIPVHRELIHRGLIELTQTGDPESLLLTGVQDSSDGTYSSWYTKIYSRMLKKVSIHSRYKKTFHSLRHNFRDACREAEIPDEVINRLGGWTTDGVSTAYGQGVSMEKLKDFIDRVQYLW